MRTSLHSRCTGRQEVVVRRVVQSRIRILDTNAGGDGDGDARTHRSVDGADGTVWGTLVRTRSLHLAFRRRRRLRTATY